MHDVPPKDTKPDPSGPGDELPPPQNPGVSDKPPNGGNPAPFQSVPAQPTPPPENTGDPVIPPQKSDPDPSKNGTPPEIPIFLGPTNPSNDRPSSGDIGPSSDPPWATDPHEKGFEDDYDPHCDRISGISLINILSNNGGDGGDASSGKATRQENSVFICSHF